MAGELFLAGSLPVETAEQAFRLVGGPLGRWLSFMPDGEVGDRNFWVVTIAYRVFNGHPELETIRRPAPDENGVEWWRSRGHHDLFAFRVRPGIKRVRFGDPGWRLGFARDAVNSYALFRYMRKEGVVPAHVRFQVCMPLTYSAVFSFFSPEDLDRVVPGVTEAFRAEVAKIVELIPAEDLAIQWDLAMEHRMIENKLGESTDAGIREAQRVLAPASEIPIPESVSLGYHACFGTLNGWPSRQPGSLDSTVLLMNAAVAASNRRVDFLHIPTLGSAADEFFAPLTDLKADGAKIYMGTIHHLHGPQGMKGQIDTIRKYISDFGLSAPCG